MSLERNHAIMGALWRSNYRYTQPTGSAYLRTSLSPDRAVRSRNAVSATQIGRERQGRSTGAHRTAPVLATALSARRSNRRPHRRRTAALRCAPHRSLLIGVPLIVVAVPPVHAAQPIAINVCDDLHGLKQGSACNEPCLLQYVATRLGCRRMLARRPNATINVLGHQCASTCRGSASTHGGIAGIPTRRGGTHSTWNNSAAGIGWYLPSFAHSRALAQIPGS